MPVMPGYHRPEILTEGCMARWNVNATRIEHGLLGECELFRRIMIMVSNSYAREDSNSGGYRKINP